MNHADVLNACSDLLEARGARPVPRANPAFSFNLNPGAQPACPGCRHPQLDHGATGECWNVTDSGRPCTCAAETTRSAAA
jgi:hypothetical protein